MVSRRHDPREHVQWTRLSLAEMRNGSQFGFTPAHCLPAPASPICDTVQWVSPDGAERVPVTFRAPRTREAAIERVARQIAKRPDLIIGWQWSSGSGAHFLRFRGWRLLPDDEQTEGL